MFSSYPYLHSNSTHVVSDEPRISYGLIINKIPDTLKVKYNLPQFEQNKADLITQLALFDKPVLKDESVDALFTEFMTNLAEEVKFPTDLSIQSKTVFCHLIKEFPTNRAIFEDLIKKGNKPDLVTTINTVYSNNGNMVSLLLNYLSSVSDRFKELKPYRPTQLSMFVLYIDSAVLADGEQAINFITNVYDSLVFTSQMKVSVYILYEGKITYLVNFVEPTQLKVLRGILSSITYNPLKDVNDLKIDELKENLNANLHYEEMAIWPRLVIVITIDTRQLDKKEDKKIEKVLYFVKDNSGKINNSPDVISFDSFDKLDNELMPKKEVLLDMIRFNPEEGKSYLIETNDKKLISKVSLARRRDEKLVVFVHPYSCLKTDPKTELYASDRFPFNPTKFERVLNTTRVILDPSEHFLGKWFYQNNHDKVYLSIRSECQRVILSVSSCINSVACQIGNEPSKVEVKLENQDELDLFLIFLMLVLIVFASSVLLVLLVLRNKKKKEEQLDQFSKVLNEFE